MTKFIKDFTKEFEIEIVKCRRIGHQETFYVPTIHAVNFFSGQFVFPMRYVELTKEIMKTKESKGKTPERTMIAVIQRDKHNVFVRMGEGVFGLNKFSKIYEVQDVNT